MFGVGRCDKRSGGTSVKHGAGIGTSKSGEGGHSRIAMQIFICSGVVCWPDLSVEPATACGASVLHVGECGSELMSGSWRIATWTSMSTSTMCPSVFLRLGAIVAIVIAMVAVAVTIAVTIAVAIAVVVAIVIVVTITIAVVVAVVVTIAVVVAIVAHHGCHHVLHLCEHGGLSGLQISFLALETVVDFSI